MCVCVYVIYVSTDMSFLMAKPSDGEGAPCPGVVTPWCHPKCRDLRHQNSFETKQKWGYHGDIMSIYMYMPNVTIFGRF